MGISWLYGIHSKYLSSPWCYLCLIYFSSTLTLLVFCGGRSVWCNMLWREEMFHKSSFWLFLCLHYHLERIKGGGSDWWSRWIAGAVTSVVTYVNLGKFTLGSGRIALQLLKHMEPPVGKCVGMRSAELPSASNLGAGCAPSEATENQIILQKNWGYARVRDGGKDRLQQSRYHLSIINHRLCRSHGVSERLRVGEPHLSLCMFTFLVLA